jgi:hypothetical protein
MLSKVNVPGYSFCRTWNNFEEPAYAAITLLKGEDSRTIACENVFQYRIPLPIWSHENVFQYRIPLPIWSRGNVFQYTVCFEHSNLAYFYFFLGKALRHTNTVYVIWQHSNFTDWERHQMPLFQAQTGTLVEAPTLFISPERLLSPCRNSNPKLLGASSLKLEIGHQLAFKKDKSEQFFTHWNHGVLTWSMRSAYVR